MENPRNAKLGDLMENEDQLIKATAYRLYDLLAGKRLALLAERVGRPYFASSIPKNRPPSSIPPRG